MKKKNKTISAEQFVERCTNITVEFLSTLPLSERRKRVRAFKKIVTTTCHDKRPKQRVASGLPGLRMSARECE